jgi:cytochrome P450
MTSKTPSIPTAPGRIPGIGHIIAMGLRPLEFLDSFRNDNEMVKIYFGAMPTIVLNSPDLIHQVMVTKANSFVRGRLYEKLKALVGESVGTTNGTLHKKRRRMMQPAFQHETIGHHVDIMREHANQFIDSCCLGQILQLEPAFRQLSFRIVTNSLIQAKFSSDMVQELVSHLMTITDELFWRIVMPDWFSHIPIKRNRLYNEAIWSLRKATETIISTYESTEIDHNDILSMLMTMQDPETHESISKKQLIDEIVTIIFAGSDTVASTFCWLFYELARRPEIERRLLHEIDAVLANRPVAYKDIPNLIYMRRVILETLRLHPPAWVLMRQSIQEVDLGGVTIPSGTEILISPYIVHRDPQSFQVPLQFDPDRWESNGEERTNKAFMPLGSGPHLCIGYHYAMTEICVVLATVVRQWRFLPVDNRFRRPVVRFTLYPPRTPVRVEKHMVT